MIKNKMMKMIKNLPDTRRQNASNFPLPLPLPARVLTPGTATRRRADDVLDFEILISFINNLIPSHLINISNHNM